MIKLLFAKFHLLLILSLVLIPMPVFAQTPSSDPAHQSQPIVLELTNQNVVSGRLTGTIKATNPNNSAFSDSFIVAKLLSPDKTQVENRNGVPTTVVLPGSLITFQTLEKRTINSTASQNFPLSLEVGLNLTSGSYDLQLALFSSENILLGSKTQSIDIDGRGSSIQINSCVLVVDEVEYAPTSGPNVAPKGDISAKCSVTNPTSNEITVYSFTEYAVNSVANSPNKQQFDPKIPILIEANTTKEILLTLPSLETPQVYEGITQLKDQSGSPVSPQVAFRWVVAGASAQIRTISTDKTSYKKGESAIVTIGADPSLDLYWRGGGPTESFDKLNASKSGTFVNPKLQGTPLQNPTIEVIVKDGKGKECGRAEQKVTGAKPEQNIWPDQTINVLINENCDKAQVEVKVKNDGQVLAAKEYNPNKESMVAETASRNRLILGLIVMILLILAAAVAFYFYKKHKKKPPVPPAPVTAAILLLISVGWFLSATPTIAANQSISVGTNEVYATRPTCPGPDWHGQPQGPNYLGPGCILGIVSGYNWTTFHNIDTSNEISIDADGKIHAHISGQFTGTGCVNAQVGLIVRAFVKGSQQGVSINGGGPRIEFPNLALHGGGNGTAVDKNLTITSNVNQCGPVDVRIEIIPFLDHVGRLASDKAEDRLLTDAEVPGWSGVTYSGRKNCGGDGSCWATIQKSVDAGSCADCGTACTTPADCQGAKNNCTSCLPNADGQGSSCQPPPACGTPCTTPANCQGAQNGCSSCLPSKNGQGTTCQAPPACGNECLTPADCTGAQNGCTMCLPNLNGVGKSCQGQPRCGTPCLNPASCEGAQNGCTSCIKEASGSAVCGKCPVGMNYDPTQQKCVCPNPGETNPHGVCDGDKCTQLNSCGITECTTDKQCFAEEMCKCDGFDATQLEYPSTKPFSFDAFAKVEGTDISKALVEGIRFKMSESDKNNPNAGTIIAQSPLYTPQIVSSSSAKLRYKATWTMPPPQIKPGKIYRVFSEIKCSPKKKRSTANANDPKQYQSKVAGVVSTAQAQEPGGDDLQLKTLNFVKKGQTDNCRFLFFEYNEGL